MKTIHPLVHSFHPVMRALLNQITYNHISVHSFLQSLRHHSKQKVLLKRITYSCIHSFIHSNPPKEYDLLHCAMSATEGHRGLDLRLWLYIHWGEVAGQKNVHTGPEERPHRARRTSSTVRGSSIQRANGSRTTRHSPFHEERQEAVTREFAWTADDSIHLNKPSSQLALAQLCNQKH